MANEHVFEELRVRAIRWRGFRSDPRKFSDGFGRQEFAKNRKKSESFRAKNFQKKKKKLEKSKKIRNFSRKKIA